MRLISQLINSVSRVHQKLLKYFNGTIISTSLVQSLSVLPVVFCLNLNDALSPGESLNKTVKACLSLEYCYTPVDPFELVSPSFFPNKFCALNLDY